MNDGRIQELVNIIYYETDSFYSIEKVELLIYLIDREFYKNYNYKATGIGWIKDRVPTTNRVKSSINDNEEYVYCYFDNDKELIRNVIDKYEYYSTEKLKDECKDENYRKAERNSVITFN